MGGGSKSLARAPLSHQTSLTNHKKIKDKIVKNSKMAMGVGEWALNPKNEAFLRRGKGVCETVLVTNR